MAALRDYFLTFITDPDIVNLVLGTLVIVLASNFLGALGLDFINRR